MGQREFMHDEHAPATEFHPELMKLLPAEKSPSMAKVTVNAAEVVTSDTIGAPVESGQTMPVTSSDNASNDDAAADISAGITAAEFETATPTEIAVGQCMFIGPYLTVIDRGRAGRQLQDMNINFSESEVSEGRPLGYRVYQGPFDTSEDVYRAKRRLEKQGVKDLYLMNEGPNTKYISLGFFSNEKSAG